MLIYSMSVSADGFIADRDGAFRWTAPGDESRRVLRLLPWHAGADWERVLRLHRRPDRVERRQPRLSIDLGNEYATWCARRRADPIVTTDAD
ncbi:MAG: hypothetical protein JWN09_612 [Microbacteriaceae bacterium]|jgi:hypothetical protein|nr:hypothetical protein [Microbacteriaceae bacterium]